MAHTPSSSRIAGLTAAFVTAGVVLSTFGSLPAFAAAAPPQVSARQADSLTDSYGVNVHLAYGTTPYANVEGITQRLTELGVRHLRDRYYANRPDNVAKMRSIAATGMRFNLIIGNPVSVQTPTELIDEMSRTLPTGVVESVEGANEWNLSNRTNWAAENRVHQQELYRASKANPVTRNLPVLAPALGLRRGHAALGDMRTMSDLGNSHLYAGGGPPSTGIEALNAEERTIVGDKPIAYTEVGYHNGMNTAESHKPTPEGIVGTYAPKLLLEHYLRGTARTYTYELLDQRTDAGQTDREAHFGLLRHDLSPKPAFTAMQNLIALTQDKGAAFTPGSLGYEVTGGGADLRQVLLQKRDGRFYLLLWRDVSIYNPVTEVPTAVTPDDMTVELGAPATVTRFLPSTSPAPVLTTSGTQIPITLDGAVTALEITPARTPDAPTAVSATAGDASAAVSWVAPAGNGGSPLTGYSVVATPGGAATSVEGASTSTTVGGLTNGTAYTFRVTALNQAGSSAPSAPSAAVTPVAPVRMVEEGSVRLDGWRVDRLTASSGGTTRVSRTPLDSTAFSFSGTSVTWKTHTGPNMGQARVHIDGVDKGLVELYTAAPEQLSKTFSGLSNRSHRLTVTVEGTRAPASAGSIVSVDGFVVGTVTTEDTSTAVRFGSWYHREQGEASGGSYRYSTTPGSTTALNFTGTSVDWITATGPAYGKAQVIIDGAAVATVDLSAATTTWQARRTFGGLSDGEHLIEVKVLGLAGASGIRTAVLTDGFEARG